MNRRHFLTMIASGIAAPAIVKAENLMRIRTPPQQIIVNPFAGMWQDAAGRYPVTEVGQRVGMWVSPDGVVMKSPLHARPRVCRVNGKAGHGVGVMFTGHEFMEGVVKHG